MKVAVNTAKLLRNVPLPDEIAQVHDNAIVLDVGTGSTRIGFSGEDAPRLTVPSVIAESSNGTECFQKAYQMRDATAIQRPLDRGLVSDWKGVEAMLSHVHELLKLRDDPAPIMLSEAALAPKEQREQMVQILFETLDVKSLYFATAPVLSLYASGRTTGMVIEMGHGTCHTVPVFEGYGLFHSILQMDYGGHDLTNWLGEHITKGGHTFPPHYQSEIWAYIKEMHSPVMADRGAYDAATNESKRGDVVRHQLPDGSEVPVGIERYTVCESFFDPTLIGKTGTGLHQLAVESVRKCDLDIAPQLFSNVVLSGGGSLFSGLPDRLNKELFDLVPQEKVRTFASTERQQASWVGGSILASLPAVQDMWVTKAEYEEAGDTRRTLATRNCF